MSVTIVLTLVLALAMFTCIVFVAVVLGIRSEPRGQMTTQAQRPLAAIVRHLLGVYVGKPIDANASNDRDECLTGNTNQQNKGGWDR